MNASRCTPHSESIVRGYRREVRYMHVQWSANRNAQLTDAHPLMDGSVYVPCYCLCTLDLISIYVAIITVLKALLGTTKVLVSYVRRYIKHFQLFQLSKTFVAKTSYNCYYCHMIAQYIKFHVHTYVHTYVCFSFYDIGIIRIRSI